MSIPLLNDPQQALLKILQEKTEGGTIRNPDGALWGQVYLDNIEVPGLSPAQTAGHLSVLKSLGLYRPVGDGFGAVRIDYNQDNFEE